MTTKKRKPSKPKLPPLVRMPDILQMDTLQDRWRPWRLFHSLYSAREYSSGWSVPAVVRRLSDGKIVYRNKAAREAGF